MPWFRVDDTLSSHPKSRAAGLPAMGLWALAGSYAAQYLTEGFVPEWYVLSWAQGKKHAASLVSAGLWVVVDGGWQFHQWDERQPSKEHVEAERMKTRERVAKWRANKPVVVTEPVSNGASNGVTNGVSTPSPALPSPTHKKETAEPRKRGMRIPDGWKPTPGDVQWQRDHGIPDALARREFEKFGNYWRAKSADAARSDWSLVWHNWLLTAQERAPTDRTDEAKAKITARLTDPLASAR